MLLLVLLGFTHLVGGALIADSRTGFSGVQGQNGWYYNYYDTGIASKQLIRYDTSWITSANGFSWHYSTNSWCQISDSAMHTMTGGGVGMCATPSGYCAPSLLWLNGNNFPDAYIRLISSHSASLSASIDGVILQVIINGVVVETFSTPFAVDKYYYPESLTSIEIVLDPKSTCNSDGTSLRLQILGPEPSPSPSLSQTSSVTPSSSGSATATATATGLCNDIKNYVHGIFETVSNYNLFYGLYITTPYLENFDMLLGVYNGCSDYGSSCLCLYTKGYSIGCSDNQQRNALINFTYGSVFQTNWISESDCVYNFKASYIRPSVTPSSSPSPSITPSATSSSTTTPSPSSSLTASSSPSFTSTQTPSETSSATPTMSCTSSQSATLSPSSSPSITPIGICNDVQNYVFGRIDRPTKEYTVIHGEYLTHYYYPATYVTIGTNPTCVDHTDECVCYYHNGDTAFCNQPRQGIIRYSIDNNYKTILVNDSDPICTYQFNTTFWPMHMSFRPTPSPSPSPSQVPNFVSAAVSILPLPPNFPSIPNNASDDEYARIASSFVETIHITDGSAIDYLSVLASSLAAVSPNLTLEISGPDFTWCMTPTPAFAAPISVGNVSAVLPPLANGMVYSFLTTPSDNSSFPSFSINALGTANDLFTIRNLETPLLFEVATLPPDGQTIECIYWNGTSWDIHGCEFINGTCACTHFTEFSARFTAIVNTNADLFSAAKDVYSLDGLQKYGGIYATLITLFVGLAGLFIYLIILDVRGERIYRETVENIDEVCKILGYDKPIIEQPIISFPAVDTSIGYLRRFCTAFCSRVVYQHAYIGLFFKYDPRLARGFRLLLLATVAFHTIWLTTFLYGYSKVDATMTIIESVVLSLITSALNIPFIQCMMYLMNTIGFVEYTTRFPEFANEYNRRRNFEKALQYIRSDEILRVINRIRNGKSLKCAVHVSPRSTRFANTTLAFEPSSMLVSDNTDNAILEICNRLYSCMQHERNKGSLLEALEIAENADHSWEVPACNCLPIKTLYGFLFSCGAFTYIFWIMNYILLFTASQSSEAMNSIAGSFAMSQATSIVLTQPLTLLLTLAGTLGVRRLCGSRYNRHIGYFADPDVRKSSTSLSGSWAYWIFLYGGSISSIGFNKDGRSLGYSSSNVAFAWLNGIHNAAVSERDTLITTLYVYLRGIEKPVLRREAARLQAAEEMRFILQDIPKSSLVVNTEPSLEETCEISGILNKISPINKNV
jgi:hypothetical protein